MMRRFDFEKQRKTDKGKRGIAIEMAIVTVFVMVALSIVLVSTALILNSHKQKTNETLSKNTELDVIGESFIAAVTEGEDPEIWKSTVTDYTAQIEEAFEEEQRTLTLTLLDAENTAVFTLILQGQGSTYTVIRWDYN